MYDLKVEVDEQEWQRIKAQLAADEKLAEACRTSEQWLAGLRTWTDSHGWIECNTNLEKFDETLAQIRSVLADWDKAKKGG